MKLTVFRFTLLELLVVMFIMVIAGALVIGQLSKMPAFAVLKETAARVEKLYAFASEMAVTYNRPVELAYRDSDNVFFIVTKAELTEPDYGKITTQNRYATTDAEYNADALGEPRRGRQVKLPTAGKLAVTPPEPSPEEVLEMTDIAGFDWLEDKEDVVDYEIVATFFPNGAAAGRNWHLQLGKQEVFAVLNPLNGSVRFCETKPADWGEAADENKEK